MDQADIFDRILALSRQGFSCSQIMLLHALDADGTENPGLVRTMSGLCGGLGFSGRTCGVLTGGCCLIGYFAGQGEPEELPHPDLNAMVRAYADWFVKDKCALCGGAPECSALLSGDMTRRLSVCPALIADGIEKAYEILGEYGAL